ncbi:MAG TPA: RecX family transcriptional regulator [Candidatus Saccharimonadales bacterium]|nr:RecX family transcriptional regulator [Candidatus Saccharimonadales bacterium]
MKVTGLSSQQKDPNRINILVDGKFRFSLDISQVTDLGIRVGKEFTEEKLDEFEVESQFGKLYARALEYCIMRPHSAREVRDYLYRKTRTTQVRNKHTGKVKERPGVSIELTTRVFERLLDKGYIDDTKFTHWWVENRNQRKGVSRRKLQSELSAKGVASGIIEEAIASTERNDGDELAKIVSKKRAKYPDNQKFMQYLTRQGFSYDDIKSALNKGDD